MDQTGAWLVNVALQSADGESTGAIPAAVSIPYPDEYRATTDNAALLHELAQRTGGRVLSIGDVEMLNLFEREGLEIPVSPKPVWDILAMLAAAFLIIDIAIRRLWIDRKSVQTMLAPVSKATTSSVEALRRVREKKDRREPRLEEESESFTPTTSKVHSKPEIQEEAKDRDDNLGQLLKRKRERGEQGDER